MLAIKLFTFSLLTSAACGASVGLVRAHEKLHAKPRDDLPTPALPFKKIVAFGDDFTDNAEGSYAHGITGNRFTGAGKLMWGNGTFTDGQVAVSYFAQDLHLPLTVDYAFGSADGAQYIGSVCDSALVAPTEIPSYAKLLGGQVVPSAQDQVKNYTTSRFTNAIQDTLHFFWTGNNDVIASLGWVGRFTICTDGLCDEGQDDFVNGLVGCYNSTLNKLVDAGAKYVLVPNIYPRDLAPWTSMWIASSTDLIQNFGSVIDKVNSRLSDVVDSINDARGTSLRYYDANGWFKRALKDRNISGVASQDGYPNTCVDGCVIQNPTGQSNWKMYWDNTIVKKHPDDFFWMTEVMPSTTVMKSLGADMVNYVLSVEW